MVKKQMDKASCWNILKLAFPLMLANMSDLILSTVDAIFVGQLGVSEIAAVGLSGLFIWASYNLFKGPALSVNALVSQYFGAGYFSKCGQALINGIIISLFSGILLLVYRIFIPDLVALMKPSNEIQELATSYIQIRMFGGVWFLIKQTEPKLS
jgi:MATE family multidrug resistance protein